MSARSDANCTSFNRSCLPLLSRKCSSSKLRSKWSSIARLLRPVMMRMSSSPAFTASSTTYWIAGLSTTGSISLGELFVAGRKRVPRPAAGITALRTRVIRPPQAVRRTPRSFSSPPEQPADVRRVAEHDQHGECRRRLRLPIGRSRSAKTAIGKRIVIEERGERRLVQYPGDEEPDDGEADDDQRVQHDERAARGRDALPALAVERERVADDRGDAEDARARRGRRWRARRPAAIAPLAKSSSRTSAPGLPAEQPADVRGAGVARALLQDVAAVGPGDELGARERPEQPGHGNEERDRRACAAHSGAWLEHVEGQDDEAASEQYDWHS